MKRGRTGTKQGPLLMGDDFEGELKRFCASEPTSGDDDLVRQLQSVPAPNEGDWRLLDPPEKTPSDADLLEKIVFPRGCRTVGIGTGRVRAEVFKDNRGKFDVLCAAGSGQYSYTVSSPCIRYKATAAGWVAIDAAVAIRGQSIVRAGAGGEGDGRIEIGVYAAHCWPKEKGKYWQEARMVHAEAGRKVYDGEVMRINAAFPVEAGVEYSFGVGLTTVSAARNGSACGARLWGRLAWVHIHPIDGPPREVPFQRHE